MSPSAAQGTGGAGGEPAGPAPCEPSASARSHLGQRRGCPGAAARGPTRTHPGPRDRPRCRILGSRGGSARAGRPEGGDTGSQQLKGRVGRVGLRGQPPRNGQEKPRAWGLHLDLGTSVTVPHGLSHCRGQEARRPRLHPPPLSLGPGLRRSRQQIQDAPHPTCDGTRSHATPCRPGGLRVCVSDVPATGPGVALAAAAGCPPGARLSTGCESAWNSRRVCPPPRV